VLVAGFPAGSWGTNCYVVASGKGQECVVVDPGQDAASGVEDVVRENRLRPVAVLLTHGHIDHVWSVVPVCGAHDVPAYIHPDDRALLTDPARALSPETVQVLAELLAPSRLELTEPDDVRMLEDRAVLSLAGLDISVAHAPGHTRGSVTFGVPADVSGPAVLFSGDLVFRDGVGRTDLPGGDHDQLLASLAKVCLPLPDDTIVLSGHGPETTIGRERASNPWLQNLVPASGPARGR